MDSDASVNNYPVKNRLDNEKELFDVLDAEGNVMKTFGNEDEAKSYSKTLQKKDDSKDKDIEDFLSKKMSPKNDKDGNGLPPPK
ncbi:hypothetical protein [Shewanella sp. Arc9-LZ]|uniref:hypothetical protein n=1 Tax=Shewanella sp. Arc9-LZ TaxID=2698686 RepID=UPI00137BC850|nr:hypothetical protein [Shewanella sp. Arc9-LZ]QHS13178.1 hypothetical protein GUY17_08670 [Shewanella sp. Arc9-LZ]